MFVRPAQSQSLPQFTSDAVVNAASYGQPIAPGALAAIFGTNLASTTATASGAALPTDLGGTSVTINGSKVPLSYVSPTQINLQMPWSMPIALFTYVPASFVVTTPAGSSAPVPVPVFRGGPSLFSQDGSGCGQAAALNIAADGSPSVNSPSNSAAPGDLVSVYGTGIGSPFYPPADGSYVSVATSLDGGPLVVLDGDFLQFLQYAGLAPLLVGVEQINFQIPQGTDEGCAVPISIGSGQFTMYSPTVSLSIHSGGGQCVDPPAGSYGIVTLTKTFTSATAGVTTADSFLAEFPAGPGVKIPQPPVPSPPDSFANSATSVAMSRSCAVSGYSQLSAGALTFTANSTGQTVTAQPVPATGGVEYQQALPSGFLAPGPYTVSASGGPVQFQGSVTLSQPIQIQTPLSPGTQISVTQPFIVNWTGGTAGELVKLSLVATDGLFESIDPVYIDASAGSFTLHPICIGHSIETGGNGVQCDFGTLMEPGAKGISVEVDVLSEAANAESAQGVLQGVELFWAYRYIFNGLSIAP